MLYAEDNVSDVLFFTRAFRQASPETPLVHCDSGPQVRKFLANCLRTGKSLPRLIVLDIKMPGLSGLDVLEYIRDDPRLTHLPVVMLSASAEERDLNRAYKNRTNAYLVKPDRYRILRQLVHSLTEFWVGYNRQPE